MHDVGGDVHDYDAGGHGSAEQHEAETDDEGVFVSGLALTKPQVAAARPRGSLSVALGAAARPHFPPGAAAGPRWTIAAGCRQKQREG